jgi:hypothetical protein
MIKKKYNNSSTPLAILFVYFLKKPVWRSICKCKLNQHLPIILIVHKYKVTIVNGHKSSLTPFDMRCRICILNTRYVFIERVQYAKCCQTKIVEGNYANLLNCTFTPIVFHSLTLSVLPRSRSTLAAKCMKKLQNITVSRRDVGIKHAKCLFGK